MTFNGSRSFVPSRSFSSPTPVQPFANYFILQILTSFPLRLRMERTQKKNGTALGHEWLGVRGCAFSQLIERKPIKSERKMKMRARGSSSLWQYTLVPNGRYIRNRRLVSLSLWRQRHRSAHAAFVPSSPQLMLLALAVVAPTARHRIVISVATLSKLLDQLDIFPTYRCPKWIFFQQLIFTGRWESVQQKIYNTLKEQFYPAASLFSLFRSVWRESWGHLVGVCVTNVCKQSTCRATADLAIGPHKCANIDPAKMRR